MPSKKYFLYCCIFLILKYISKIASIVVAIDTLYRVAKIECSFERRFEIHPRLRFAAFLKV